MKIVCFCNGLAVLLRLFYITAFFLCIGVSAYADSTNLDASAQFKAAIQLTPTSDISFSSAGFLTYAGGALDASDFFDMALPSGSISYGGDFSGPPNGTIGSVDLTGPANG